MTLAELEDALGHCYLYGGDYPAVRTQLDLALADPATGSVVRSELLSLNGMWHHYRAIALDAEERSAFRHTDERVCFEEALGLAGDSETVARARALFGLGLVDQVLDGDLIRAAPRFVEAQRVLDSCPGPPALLHSEVIRHVGFDHLVRLGDHATAIELLTRSLRLREQLPERGWTASGHAALSAAHRLAGHLETAVAHGQQAVDIALCLGLGAPSVELARAALERATTAREEAPRHDGPPAGR